MSWNTDPRLVLGATFQKATQVLSGASSSGWLLKPQKPRDRDPASMSSPGGPEEQVGGSSEEQCQTKRQRLL